MKPSNKVKKHFVNEFNILQSFFYSEAVFFLINPVQRSVILISTKL